MKRLFLFSGLFLSTFLLSACGAKTGDAAIPKDGSAWIGMAPGDDLTAIAERTEYYDLAVQSANLFNLGLWEQTPQNQSIQTTIAQGGTVYLPIATQFWEDEPVQLWTEASSELSNVWLYRKDGSGEILLQDAPRTYLFTDSTAIGAYQWYMAQNGDFYCYRTLSNVIGGEMRPAEGTIVKIHSSGDILYESTLEPGLSILDMVQTKNGQIYLLLQTESEEQLLLAELNSSTGTLISECQWELPFEQGFPVYLGTAGNSPAILGYCDEDRNYRIAEVRPDDGSIIPVLYFAGTSYSWDFYLTLPDFRMTEDGIAELLLTDFYRLNCTLDRIQMQLTEKIPIIVRGGYFVDTNFKQWVSRFNLENETYHVILEDCVNLDDMEDFARLTSVQMNAGKGPDILYGCDLMQDYIVGMLDKGALEDLHPYMDASGISEEDYFPAAFSTWRQGEHIYGVLPIMLASTSRQLIDEELLGNRETPDIETLMDALLARGESGVYYKGFDSGQVLKYWLEGTESLFGMVDWENGSCDFNTPLFGKLLEAARRYGDDGRTKTEDALAEYGSLSNVFVFHSKDELEASGKVIVGTQFDDGCYAAVYPLFILAVNAKSSHKEGAWEFIRFLLSEELQSTSYNEWTTPVNRNAFEKWMQETIITLTEVKYINGLPVNSPRYYGEKVSEETKAEYRQAIEEAQPLPVRTAFILEIILEEAQDYFNGYKNAEQVSMVVNNRVQLYLDENR